jgi:hypothetical protein
MKNGAEISGEDYAKEENNIVSSRRSYNHGSRPRLRQNEKSGKGDEGDD